MADKSAKYKTEIQQVCPRVQESKSLAQVDGESFVAAPFHSSSLPVLYGAVRIAQTGWKELGTSWELAFPQCGKHRPGAPPLRAILSPNEAEEQFVGFDPQPA